MISVSVLGGWEFRDTIDHLAALSLIAAKRLLGLLNEARTSFE
jgi:hypothetical protein